MASERSFHERMSEAGAAAELGCARGANDLLKEALDNLIVVAKMTDQTGFEALRRAHEKIVDCVRLDQRFSKLLQFVVDSTTLPDDEKAMIFAQILNL